MADSVTIAEELRAIPQKSLAAVLTRVFSHFLIDDMVSVTKTHPVLAQYSGKTYLLNAAGGFVNTLPAPAKGLRYRFIVQTAPSGGSYTIVTLNSANIIIGLQTPVDGAPGDFGTADDTISFVDGQSVAGDKCELYSDGVNWYAYAISKVAAGMTFSQAS